MRPVGFSTGALARGDFRRGLGMVADNGASVVELSALRDHELPALMRVLVELDLTAFTYVSVHAPSRFRELREAVVIELLTKCIDLEIPVVLHPDAMSDVAGWEQFGELLCIENMDNRKPKGRTRDELAPFFEKLPAARFCLDLAHARQVDGTMTAAREMLRSFGDRLGQIHMSEIDSAGRHYGLSRASVRSFRRIARLIPETTPIILESPVTENELHEELMLARLALTPTEPGTARCEAVFVSVD